MANDRIFETYAPLYWAAGLPVIPLRERNKMPDINQWSVYGREMPSEALQQHWLASYPKGNIGLPFGPESGLCAIDIDTEDEELTAAIIKICGKSPWVRVGKKGMGIAYRWQGQRNFKLRNADGGMICEFLGMGNQMVMPPSIHPDTGLPYTATANLWEIYDDIPEIDLDIEDKLRAMLGKMGFAIGSGARSAPLDIIPSGERDVQMVRHAGYLARVVLGIDRSTSFSLIEAIAHMHHWVSEFTARVSGDQMDPNKGVAKLLEFILKDLEKGRTMPEGWDSNLPDEWRAHPTIQMLIERNTQQRWSVTRAREWLSGKIAEKPQDDDWAIDRVKEAIANVAADEHFSEFDMRMLVTAIQGLCRNLDLKKTDLMQLFKAERRSAVVGEAETQASIAKSVLEELQRAGEIRYDHSQFWQWNGSCFEKLDEDTIYTHVATNVKDSTLVRRHSEYNAVVEIMARLCRGALVTVEDRGINFANGFVGEDLRVLDHDPKFGATFTLPFNYEPDAATRCPRWMELLHSCWGMESDFEDRMKSLQEMFAATLFKIATDYQKAFLLYGRAGTGKTVVLNVLRSMLPPDAVANLGPEKWGERFTLVDLIGKAANICGELPENGVIAGKEFKEVVEGSTMRSEFKGQDGFSFTPQCGNWFASNYIPVSRDSSLGFIRRWQILDFNHPVPAEKRIENLADLIVAEERTAIAAWALEGLRRLLDQRGYTIPACHVRRLGQMRRINNSVQAFLEDEKSLKREGQILCRDLYDLYVFYQRDVGRGRAVSFERFTQMLEDLDLTVDHRMDGLGQSEPMVVGLSRG